MLHPVVVYYKENGKLAQKSLCFISEYLEHDTEFVYELQRELVKPVVKLLNKTIPTITKFEYFSDRCAAQYKYFKNMLNLCQHKVDFGIEATWSFFVTSHGKSPCDGIGVTVRRLTAKQACKGLTRNKFWMFRQCFHFGKHRWYNIYSYLEGKNGRS